MTTVPIAATPKTQNILLVHAYADGELDPASALAIERKMAEDPTLAAELSRTAALRDVLRERLPRVEPPAHLRSKIESAIGLSRSRVHPSWRALAASVILALALGSGTTWYALHPNSGDHIAEEVLDGHMRALLSAQATEVASSERHTVKPWFNTRLPQAPRVVDLGKDDFPLIGARIDVIGATPVPTLVYGRRLHIISLSAVPAAQVTLRDMTRRSINGYNLVGWSDNSVFYWAASDLNANELDTFVKFFRSAPADQ